MTIGSLLLFALAFLLLEDLEGEKRIVKWWSRPHPLQEPKLKPSYGPVGGMMLNDKDRALINRAMEIVKENERRQLMPTDTTNRITISNL